MTGSLGPAGFFALEAGECLDRLDTMFGSADGPPADEFVRVARALRGSALLANLPHLARAAAEFEGLARAYRDGTRAWDAATRELAGQAAEEYRQLVRRVPEWQEADAARAARLAAQLESLAGQGPAQAERLRRASAAAAELQTGVRAFVAREGALIASALDRAARALRAAPQDREPLYMVLRRMQPLQGLAELPDLPPLADILDGIELAVGDLSRLHAPPPGVEAVLQAGAHALARVARDIAERGAPDPEAEEPRRFTALLLDAFAVERDVVPIETLYPAGEKAPLTPPPVLPQFGPPEPPGSLELVSLGEHLVQIATLLERARPGTELDLRLYRLVGTLRSAASPPDDPVASALGAVARAAREAVASGAAQRRTPAFAAALQEIGQSLRGADPAVDRAGLARRLLDGAERLARVGQEPAVAEPVVAEPALAEPAGAGPGAEPVPIESLAPDFAPAAAPAPPAPDLAAAAAGGAEARAAAGSRIEAAFITYDRLVRERGLGEPSLAALLGRPAAAEPAVVPIESLCYRGRGALERAAAVGRELREQLAAATGLAEVRPLLDELLDLVPLALAEPE